MSVRVDVSILLAVVLAAIGAGCGGDDSADSPNGAEEAIDTSSLSKAAFVKQANAICSRGKQEGAKQLGDYVEKRSSEEDPASKELLETAFKATVLPAIETEIAEIRELGAPQGEEDRVEAFLVANQEAVDAVKEKDEIPPAFEIDPAFERPGLLASEYGLNDCVYRSPPAE